MLYSSAVYSDNTHKRLVFDHTIPRQQALGYYVVQEDYYCAHSCCRTYMTQIWRYEPWPSAMSGTIFCYMQTIYYHIPTQHTCIYIDIYLLNDAYDSRMYTYYRCWLLLIIRTLPLALQNCNANLMWTWHSFMRPNITYHSWLLSAA